MKYIYLIILGIGILSFFPLSVRGQQTMITGRLVLAHEKQASEGLPYANVSLYQLPDSVFVRGASTDADGRFRMSFNKQSSSRYLLKASFTGCNPLSIPLVFHTDTLNLGTMTMTDDALTLREIVVTAPARPMSHKGDTLIYNAAAFKTPEGSYLEALVRRVPGLTYDPKDHTISYNGYDISEITVNGKDFFKGNLEVALLQLPVSLISQLQVFDKATDEEKATGFKSNRKNYVLDVQTKQEMNGTMMLFAEAGYGTHDKHHLAAGAMRFKEGGDNFTLTAQSGNRNFHTPYPKNRSDMVGINLTQTVKDKLNIMGSVNYYGRKDGSQSSAYNEQYLSNTSQHASSENRRISRTHNGQASLTLNWDIDSLTTLNISGNGSLNFNDNQNEGRNATFSQNPGLDVKDPFATFEQTDRSIRINDNRQQSKSAFDNQNYNFRTSLIRRLRRKGNSISLSFNTMQNSGTSDNFTRSTTQYYRIQNADGTDSLLQRNQYREQPNRQHTYEAGLSYTHALNPKTQIQLGYTFSQSQEKLDEQTYALDRWEEDDLPFGTLPADYERGRIDSLSNRSRSLTTGHHITLRFNHNGSVWGIQTSLDMQPMRRSIRQTTGVHRADTTACSIEWRPDLSLTFDQNNNYLSINYSGSTVQPSLSDLIAPTDYSSPLDITRSNPNLRPSYNHNLGMMYSNFMQGIIANLMWNQEINTVNRTVIYNSQTGGRETMPVNINGNWSVSGSASYDKRIRQFRMVLNGNGRYNHYITLVGQSNGESAQSATHATGLSSNLRLSYLPAWGNIDLVGEWSFDQSKNSMQQSNTYTRQYAASLEASISLPASLTFQTDAQYNHRNGTGISDEDENEVIWNLKLSWKFAKKKRMELSAYWADILNQVKNFTRTATATGFYERYEEQIRTYFMVSLKYRFDKMN